LLTLTVRIDLGQTQFGTACAPSLLAGRRSGEPLPEILSGHRLSETVRMRTRFEAVVVSCRGAGSPSDRLRPAYAWSRRRAPSKIRARDASTPPPPSIRWVPAPPRLEHRTGCLDSQRNWLTVERLPAYAPELNAVEYLWANLKDVELANLPTTTLAEVADATEQGIGRVCNSDSLVVGVPGPHRPHARPMNRQPNPRNSMLSFQS
jgi:hypothetical protein